MKKKYKMRRVTKILSILAAAVFLAAALTGCQSAGTELSDKFDEETIKSEAMKAIELFNDRDYEGICDMGTQEFKDLLTYEEYKEQCDPFLDKCGEFKEISKTVVMGSKDKKTGAEYGGAVMVGTYEDGKIQFTIGFDEDMKLVQFLIK